MAFESKYFIFNRQNDWQLGFGHRLRADSDTLAPQPAQPGLLARAVWFSPVMDSLESGTLWHRLRLEADIPSGAVIYARLYAGDSPGIAHEETVVPLDSLLSDPGQPLHLKEQLMASLAPQRVENPLDMPLFGLRGRYLWLMLELTGDGASVPAVHCVKAEFPMLPFTAYLPEIYRRSAAPDAFLNRLMAMLQAVYIDLEERIDTLPARFSPETTDPDFLKWLAEWLSLGDSFMWEEARLRALLPELVDLYRAKGTRRALSRVIELFLGHLPHIVEQAQAMRQDGGRGEALIGRLYGESTRDFCVLVDAAAIPDRRVYSALGQIIDSFAPAGTRPRLVGLQNLFVLDDHVYLGANTVLGMYVPLVLDGTVPIPMGTLE